MSWLADEELAELNGLKTGKISEGSSLPKQEKNRRGSGGHLRAEGSTAIWAASKAPTPAPTRACKNDPVGWHLLSCQVAQCLMLAQAAFTYT